VKEWWEEQPKFRAISEWTLQKNEWLDIDERSEDRPPYQPQEIDDDDEVEVSDRLNSEETDEEFDWFNP